MNRLAIMMSVGSLVACGSTAPPITNAPTATPAPVDGAASYTPDEPPVAGDATTIAKPVSTLPPSGLWDLRVSVLSDTCSPKVTHDGTHKGLLVYGHTVNGKTTLNLPLVVTNSSTVARSDITAQLGLAFNNSTKPDLSCPTYVVGRALLVKEVGHDRIVLVRTDTYGDRAGCSGTAPATCAAETEETYTLARSECEAPCAGQVDSSTPKAPKVKCTCP